MMQREGPELPAFAPRIGDRAFGLPGEQLYVVAPGPAFLCECFNNSEDLSDVQVVVDTLKGPIGEDRLQRSEVLD
jgi:hypothetical protein